MSPSESGRDIRLALILSGGASLGTYTAGAVSELLLALSRDRRRRASVHVIAGASAGAVTAALAARALVVNPSLLPWIGRAWVDALDADVLLNPARRDRAGLLDGDAVDELSRHLIAGGPASDDRPSEAAGDPLRVAVALSNLSGVPYDLRYGFLNAPDRRYGVRVHRDWMEFSLRPGTPAEAPVWERLRRAAVASAAFPLALPPRALRRRKAEYAGARFAGPDAPGRPEAGAGREARPEAGRAAVGNPDLEADPESLRMWYADGGLFDNEPVGLAKSMVERFPDHRTAEWRYILVDPYMEGGSDRDGGGLDPSGSTARAGAMVARALLGHAAARDWIQANKVNARLEILQALVARIPDLGDRIRDPDALGIGRAVGELAERVAEMKVAVRRGPAPPAGDPVVAYLDENLARIQDDPRFRPAFEGIGARAVRTRVAKLIFVLESAAGLRDKDVMPLYLVAPPEGERLAGQRLGNFGGFLHRPWRAHDFRAGRRDARRLLERGLDDAIAYDPDEPEAYDPRGAEAAEAPSGPAGELPPAARERLERFVRREADAVLDSLRPGVLGGLTAWAWKPVLRRWAARRVREAVRRMV